MVELLELAEPFLELIVEIIVEIFGEAIWNFVADSGSSTDLSSTLKL